MRRRKTALTYIVTTYYLKPRLHQGNMLLGRATCYRIQACLCPATCRLYLGNIITAKKRKALTYRYCFYSRADFWVFRPAGAKRWTYRGEIWQGRADHRRNMLHWCKRGFRLSSIPLPSGILGNEFLPSPVAVSK